MKYSNSSQSNSNIDEIDLAITTRIYVDPSGVAGTEINMRAKLTEEAKARVQQIIEDRMIEFQSSLEEDYEQELLKARIDELENTLPYFTDNAIITYYKDRIADLQAKLKGDDK